jgi:hypothetical protein
MCRCITTGRTLNLGRLVCRGACQTNDRPSSPADLMALTRFDPAVPALGAYDAPCNLPVSPKEIFPPVSTAPTLEGGVYSIAARSVAFARGVGPKEESTEFHYASDLVEGPVVD